MVKMKICNQCSNFYTWVCLYCYCHSNIRINLPKEPINKDTKTKNYFVYQYNQNGTINLMLTEDFIFMLITKEILYYHTKKLCFTKDYKKDTKKNKIVEASEEKNIINYNPFGFKNTLVLKNNDTYKDVVCSFFKQYKYKCFYNVMQEMVTFKESSTSFHRTHHVYIVNIEHIPSSSDAKIPDAKFSSDNSTAFLLPTKTATPPELKQSAGKKLMYPFKRLSLNHSRTSTLTNQRGKTRNDALKKYHSKSGLKWLFRSNKCLSPVSTGLSSPSSTSDDVYSILSSVNDTFAANENIVTDDEASMLPALCRNPFINQNNSGQLKDDTSCFENVNIHEIFDKSTQVLAPERHEDSRLTISSETPNRSFFTILPTTYIPNTRTIFSSGFQELQQATTLFKESEKHIKQLISKYIQNKSFEKELLEALCSYSKVQINAERTAYRLQEETWQQKLDADKVDENILQEQLNSVVKENRELQEEIEQLKSKQENQYVKTETKSQGRYNQKDACLYDLAKNNEKLRTKLKASTDQLCLFEKELLLLQNKHKNLNDLLISSQNNLHHYRRLLQNANTDHEIEESSLLNQLTLNEQVIKDSIDAGDILMDDMESLKKQLKVLPVTLNWTKFKCRGDCLTDLIHMCRAWTNEICREFLRTHTQLSLREKDNNFLQCEIVKLREIFAVTDNENRDLKSKLQQFNECENQLIQTTEKLNSLEVNTQHLQKEFDIKNEELMQEKNIILLSNQNVNELSKRLTEKEISNNVLNQRIQEYNDENTSLKSQIENLQKLLDGNHISLLVKELADAQHKIMNLQTQYAQFFAEKINLMEQSAKYSSERDSLIKYQQLCHERLQNTQHDVEQLNQQNYELKEKILNQRDRLFNQTGDFKKQVEENSVMKTIYSQLNCELLRSRTLEATTLDMNFEANRLAVAAEYNGLVSNQLYNVINNKDETISNLQHNIEKLNLVHQSNAADKMALCQELTDLHYFRKRLQDELDVEKQKVKHLTEMKDQIERISEANLQQMQQRAMEDKAAFHELYNDHTNLKTQRNNLIAQQALLKTEIEDIKSENVRLKVVQEETQHKYVKLKEKCRVLEQSLQETQRSIDVKEIRTRSEIMDYQNKLTQRDDVVEKLKREKEELANTISYLQCTSQKLYSDIDELRQTIKEHTEVIMSNKDELMKKQDEINENVILLERSYSENTNLKKRIEEIIAKLNTVLNEKEEIKTAAEKHDEDLQVALLFYQQVGKEDSEKINSLKQDNEMKEKTIQEYQLRCKDLQEQIENMELNICTLSDNNSETASKNLEERAALQEKLDNVIEEHSSCSQKIVDFTERIKYFNTELAKTKEQREKDMELCKLFLDEICNENKSQKTKLITDMQSVTAKLNEIQNIYNDKCEKFKSLEAEYRIAIDKLLTVVSILEEEKVQRQNAEKLLRKEVQKHESEMELAQCYIENLTQQLDDMNLTLGQFSQFKESLQNELLACRCSCTKYKIYADNLEKQLEEAKSELVQNENSIDVFKLDDNQMSVQGEILANVEISRRSNEARVSLLKRQLQSGHQLVLELNNEISILLHKLQVMEFQKCETIMRFHEIKGKFEVEQSLNQELKETNQRLLQAVWQTKIEQVSSLSTEDAFELIVD